MDTSQSEPMDGGASSDAQHGRRSTDGLPPRVFLVVVDDTDEMSVAIRFASQRAKNTGGRVALLRVTEPMEFQHWMGVGEIMREERRAEAEELVSRHSTLVHDISGQIPTVYVREGSPRDELIALIDEEPSISILVLAAASGNEGPGPLVSWVGGKGTTRLRIPITIVPGNLSNEQIDALS